MQEFECRQIKPIDLCPRNKRLARAFRTKVLWNDIKIQFLDEDSMINSFRHQRLLSSLSLLFRRADPWSFEVYQSKTWFSNLSSTRPSQAPEEMLLLLKVPLLIISSFSLLLSFPYSAALSSRSRFRRLLYRLGIIRKHLQGKSAKQLSGFQQ